MVTTLEIGDRVWINPGGTTNLVTETRIHPIQRHQEVLILFPWGKSHWFRSDEVYRTCSPLTKY